ncbi:aspartate ammonia-lyase [Starkeya sp. ORNL1]|uniref:aspartate ammonia-lyase n=1 Tax=Starkeya sp. ORNL1 TaxID=2709380 RepID=UPI0014637266|nr:aspartate ammonia-lyase [Starkeya sp. ORNL1]QJP15759.1 aspartate ammonia-lyase [Starkeya sp. ORNL1]
MPSVRTEHDTLGMVEVPSEALWGAQTERARRNFDVTGLPIGSLRELVGALAMVKRAAARANFRIGQLSPEKLQAIEQACNEIASGKHAAAFPVDVIQGGAGTSTNMNMNEVIANLANVSLGGAPGRYEPVHPNDDVNRSQSTNDVYPTAVRLSVILAAAPLKAALADLVAVLEEKSAAFTAIVKLGRTQLQDAVPMTLGQEFSAFATVLQEDIGRIGEMETLLCEVNLGGTAIGTGVNAAPGYANHAIAELRAISGVPLLRARNLVEASWDMGAFVLFSAMLKRLATKLSKIANDLRLLASGPRGGLGEILLPQMQPGSSIMPGKVNPVIPEMVNQVAFQVIGNDLAVTLAAEAGQLQLNAMEPLIAFNLHASLHLLTRAVRSLNVHCIAGIEADSARCRAHLDAGVSVVTALVPLIGYSNAAALALEALRLGRPIAELAVERGLFNAEDSRRLLDPLALAFPAA